MKKKVANLHWKETLIVKPNLNLDYTKLLIQLIGALHKLDYQTNC